jgi:hypothetical protein
MTRMLVHNTGSDYCTHAPESRRVVEASSAMATMIGCNSGSAAGMHPYAFIDRDDFDSLVLEEESLRSAISFKGPGKGKPRMFGAEARFKTCVQVACSAVP